jgi:hypothetical protein
MGPKSRNTQADSDRELGLRIQSEDKIERGLQILDGIKSGKPDSRARTEITSWKTESENSPEARRGTSGGEKLEQEKQIPSSAPRTKTERRAHKNLDLAPWLARAQKKRTKIARNEIRRRSGSRGSENHDQGPGLQETAGSGDRSAQAQENQSSERLTRRGTRENQCADETRAKIQHQKQSGKMIRQ